MVRHLLFGYQSDLEAAVNSWAVSKLLFWRLVNYWLLLLAYICSVKYKDFYTVFFQSWLATVLENLWYKVQDFQMGTKKLRGQHKFHLTYPNHLWVAHCSKEINHTSLLHLTMCITYNTELLCYRIGAMEKITANMWWLTITTQESARGCVSTRTTLIYSA